MSKTRGETIIEERLAELDPESMRYGVLNAALEFKASWVRLGEELTRVRTSQSFRDWGFENFNDYCKDELRITSDTAAKLCRSFLYLSEAQPSMVQMPAQGEPPPRVPDYRSVDLLARMKDNERVPEPVYRDLSQAAFDEDLGVSELRKRFREEAPQAFTSRPRQQKAEPRTLLRSALSQSAKLIETLASVDGIDDTMVEQAENLRGMIAGLLREM
ncbi:MAG: hypothetical protein ABIJ09_06460 [Pseudomonadota bacterium]